MEDSLTIAATYLCILRMLWRRKNSNLKWRTYPISLIEENRWRAQRYGVSGELLDLSVGSLIPVSDLMEEDYVSLSPRMQRLSIVNREIKSTGDNDGRHQCGPPTAGLEKRLEQRCK